MAVEQVRAHIKIRGRVQGVWFRALAQERARELGVRGWVRNCPDGSVEVVAEGEKNALQRLITWCHKGPEGALVTDVEVKWEPHRGEFQDFSIRYR